jgi:hypothetical protein
MLTCRRAATRHRASSILVLSALALACTSPRSLPPIAESDEIRIFEATAEVRRIDDRARVSEVVAVVNRRSSGWSVPWYGPPVPRTRLEFYNAGRFIGDFGMGNGFLTRTYGDFYSRAATATELQELRSALAASSR